MDYGAVGVRKDESSSASNKLIRFSISDIKPSSIVTG
jgi:hypothetical protein